MRLLYSLLGLALAMAVRLPAAVDAGLLAYVPAGSHLVSSVDLVSARSTSFGRDLIARIDTEDDNFVRLIRDTGFDPRRDLQDFIFAGGDPDRFAILARGTFDRSRIVAAAKVKGATIEEANGLDLVIEHNKDRRDAFTFLQPDVLAMADVATLKSIAANRNRPTTLNPSLQLHIAAFGATHNAWFVSVDRPLSLPKNFDFESGADDGDKMKALSSITAASGGIQFGRTVSMTLEAITRTADDATSLADLVRLVSSAVQLGRKSDTQASIVASALDRMELSSDQNNFRVKLNLPEADVERLANFTKHNDH